MFSAAADSSSATMVDIPDCEIAPFAGLERTGLTENTQRTCTFPRHTSEAFGNVAPDDVSLRAGRDS